MTVAQTSLLIIDDDMVDRMAVKRTLNKSDLEASVHEAKSIHDARQMISDHHFACLLLDYRLPDGTALDFLEVLKVDSIAIPTIILTGQGDETIAVELMKAGASDYVSKAQLSPTYLTQSIRNAIRLHQAEQEIIRTNKQLRHTNDLLQGQNQQLEQQKQQIHLQNLELVEASRLKSQFLASMSHELRTPLHAITGFSQILLQGTKGELTASQTKMIERILGNGNSLLTLLNDLLDFSKVEAGKLNLDPKPFNLSRLVLSSIEELRSLALDKDIELKSNIQLQERTFIGDEIRLKQILVNLLSNAIKFTDQGSVVVSVTEPAEQKVDIAISDTGIGISSENITTIFDPFIQANQTNSRKHAGTGLGLAICQSLVDMMQGSISVESVVNEGTTFTVSLPRLIESIPEKTLVH